MGEMSECGKHRTYIYHEAGKPCPLCAAEATVETLTAGLARWKAVAWKFSDWYGRFPGVSRELARAATLEEYERALGIEKAREAEEGA